MGKTVDKGRIHNAKRLAFRKPKANNKPAYLLANEIKALIIVGTSVTVILAVNMVAAHATIMNHATKFVRKAPKIASNLP
jgi:hypothetical protein